MVYSLFHTRFETKKKISDSQMLCVENIILRETALAYLKIIFEYRWGGRPYQQCDYLAWQTKLEWMKY